MNSVFEVEIELGGPPEVVVAARAVHGAAGKQKVERYLLPELWCMHLYHYNAVAFVDGHELKIHPGCLTLLPAGAQLEYHYNGISPHQFTHFRIAGGAATSRLRLPAMYEPGADCGRFEDDMDVMAAASLANPVRANVKLWELLWQLADRTSQSGIRHHPSLEKALALIELRLAEDIGVAALAREVGLSHNHLTRLFQSEMGRTVVGYIRHRRSERALHLLQNTTLPLRAVAAQIGVDDPRAFNALMKKETGKAPRVWRA